MRDKNCEGQTEKHDIYRVTEVCFHVRLLEPEMLIRARL